METKHQPSPDFVTNTMRQIYAYEASTANHFSGGRVYELLQRYALALSGCLFGILNATHVF